jgi:hypothetical protein
MKPTTFKEQNKTLLKPDNMTDEECTSLPVYTDDKQCISCWRMSIKERLSALLFGKVWVWVLSGKTQPPIVLEARRTVFEETNGDK